MTTAPRAAKAAPISAVQEVFLLWGACFTATVLAVLIAPKYAKLVATVGFLYAPLITMRWRDEDYADYGVTLAHWRKDLKLFLLVFAAVIPPFIVGYVVFVELVPKLPPELAKLLSPYGVAGSFQFRLPDRFVEWVIDHVFVVALPEEFFYRGYVQTRLRDAWPRGRMFLGARLGPAYWLTTILFAVGHLAIFEAWRLGTFFPALLFGWMRERTGTVIGATLFHAACNLLMLILQASFFGMT